MKQDDEELRTFLRTVIAPIGDLKLRRDLWPDMRRNLNSRIVPIPWFDYALAALLVCSVFFFPETILYLFYHL
jgi:hypothetical protein